MEPATVNEEEDEAPPPWLEDSVRQISSTIAHERIMRGDSPVGIEQKPPQQPHQQPQHQQRLLPRWLSILAWLAALFCVGVGLANIHTARAIVDAAEAAKSAAAAVASSAPPPSSGGLVSLLGGGGGSSSNYACDTGESSLLASLSHSLQSVMQRGDSAVVAASRCASALDAATQRKRELESALATARSALAASQQAMRDLQEQLLAKEVALGRLEDALGLCEQRRRTDSACCKTELSARARSEESEGACFKRLQRAERLVQRHEERESQRLEQLRVEQLRHEQQAAAQAQQARARAAGTRYFVFR